MRKSSNLRFVLCIVLFVSLFSPTAVLAFGDGKKFFKEGMRAESAEDWDKAVEQFALAVTENPKNPEYRLHYQRATFMASQMYMKKGTTLANEKDYKGGYEAFRRAYGYDPTNELAKAEMERMARLYRDENGGGKEDINGTKDGAKLFPTSYSPVNLPPNFQVPQKLEVLTDFYFPNRDLQEVIKELARRLDLNVLFDIDTFRTKSNVTIDLKEVTAAKALDYIFLQQNLFFQKVGPRTILVANQQRRNFFQQLVLRTFYLANASPKDVAKVVQQAIPVQQGRTPTIVLTDEETNSITLRDTAENIGLMEQLIKSLDKDRAEVVMDVSIYEVNKNDLLQFGNQLGTVGENGTLNNLGGVNLPFVTRGSTQNITSRFPFRAADVASIALGLPISNITALQSKSNTKLLASTQIHAFNNQDSSARIGQRVPVRTASFAPVGTTGTNNNNSFVGDVINYEQVGLTLKFKPIVFPNQDVQVAMEIESKDVAGANTLTPTFTERTIKGTARVQNNKTLLLASVAQGVESNGRSGLPLLGLIPILGRLFTAPSKDNRQVDIVIAITPRVIRAPSILPEDIIERPTGSVATPTSGSLEAMLIQDEINDQLAAARRLGNTARVQLPDQKSEPTPSYVPSDASTTAVTETPKTDASVALIRPIDSTTRTIPVSQTADTPDNETLIPKPIALPLTQLSLNSQSSALTANLQFLPALHEMKSGEKTRLAILVRTATPFRSTVLGLSFDDKKIAIRGVSFGDVFGAELAGKAATPFLNQNGKMYVSLASAKDTAENSSGILAFIDVEALADGLHVMAFDSEIMTMLTNDGQIVKVLY
jgi:general secretion pathway protein D